MEIFAAIILVILATILIVMTLFDVPLLIYRSFPDKFLIFTGVWFLLFILLGIQSPFVCHLNDSASTTFKNKTEKIISILFWSIIAILALEGILEGVLGKDSRSFIHFFYPFGGLLLSLASRFLKNKFLLYKSKSVRSEAGKE
jgi:protein-S-isoprenylcysteine O-methyltransferase Ste14